MRITGTLHGIDTYEKTFDLTRGGEVVGTAVNYHHGILITADDETLRAASNLLCATVDIYPHPVNGIVAGECTPENYAHALARLAHAEDHLAREVRSSQALADSNRALEALVYEYRMKYIEADRTLEDARETIASMNLANARLMADDEASAGD